MQPCPRTVQTFASPSLCRVLALALLVAAPGLAQAHSEAGAVGGFISGFMHPLSGLDHIAAMVAVGIWGAFLGSPAMWLLPVIFPMVMALGVPMPGVEVGIALSGVILGAMVAFAAKPPLWVASVLVAIFAIFHGYAHGAELPHAANAVTYAVGFVIATGLLHLGGIAVGLLIRWRWGRVVVRATGGAIAATGFAFLFGYL
ncbi:HupE/UreJ family protein [Rhodoferax sp.]|uniref:HupE/UreJ family protein n=1 Tax=Rhodoferax sp. TaxID=50421 RepID=UPI00374DAABB